MCAYLGKKKEKREMYNFMSNLEPMTKKMFVADEKTYFWKKCKILCQIQKFRVDDEKSHKKTEILADDKTCFWEKSHGNEIFLQSQTHFLKQGDMPHCLRGGGRLCPQWLIDTMCWREGQTVYGQFHLLCFQIRLLSTAPSYSLRSHLRHGMIDVSQFPRSRFCSGTDLAQQRNRP